VPYGMDGFEVEIYCSECGRLLRKEFVSGSCQIDSPICEDCFVKIDNCIDK
jgi:hypothetical protein